MQTLPITHVLPKVKEKLIHHNRLVLQAPPGAGKTTALPLALLDEPWLEGKQIIMLEPRRLAVRSSAARMAELLGEKVGQRVGYQIKMESVQSKATKILIVTEGILTRKLQNDPALESVALIIFDEFHERSLHADLSLALALESQSVLREDMKILVMSATLNTAAISTLLDNAPVIESQGRAFPVERIYLDAGTPQPTLKTLPSYIHKLLLKLLAEEEGNILVFLPGVRQIKAVEKLLNESRIKNTYVSTLYGNLSKEAQDRAIKAPPKGTGKVVLSTNIAQTSLTIEGIKIVIDSGLQNVSVFNPFSGMNKLESKFISKDAAIQRAGRAGRLSAGKAYHLWHKSRILQKHDTPEILSADLSQLVLELAQWGNDDINALSWMDTPPITAIHHARTLLKQLGALDSNGHITSHGEAMGSYGLHPRLAHMMLKAKEMDLSYEASLLAVLVSEKDIYSSAYTSADLRERVITLHDVAQKANVSSKYVDIKQCRYLLENARRIEKNQTSTLHTEQLGILLAFAYPDRIAQLRHRNKGTYLLSNGKGAYLHSDDTLFNSPYLAISDLDAKSTNATIYKAIALSLADIETYLGTETQERVTWNEEEARVEVRKVERFGKLTLKETQLKSTDSPEVLEVLLDEIEALGLNILHWNKEAKKFRERVNFLHLHDESFPDFSDENLLDTMDKWLAPYLQNVTTLKACRNLNLYNILLGLLSYEELQKLNHLVPAKHKVASGSQINIDYSDPQQPVLAVRLQELFGTHDTPAVLGGKVKLMLHLLSPASRPMQVTRDLKSFWENTYDEVKKELRGKYKKHYWPDDPLEAKATSKTKKNM
ncbi:ATP-dependent helicase [Sulfurovum lithotrophicum]|uniref:ATP-dependent helicase n=1 Tax=Sulfurovum lithotrophicum TaxID=206403 RepID=A0A7U4M1Z1_9BACT|nr:ATP-dependent helicase HrpB [Sulfurovum lithotrophicum]AKF25234.1 ATP-dependent helicase [Sulfurovum lithotrophicum]